MKRLVLSVVLIAALPLSAQQPAPPAQPAPQTQPAPNVPSMQERYNTLVANQQLLYEKLHAISEFQQFLKVQEDLEKLKQEYNAATTPRPAPDPPVKTPVEPKKK